MLSSHLHLSYPNGLTLHFSNQRILQISDLSPCAPSPDHTFLNHPNNISQNANYEVPHYAIL